MLHHKMYQRTNNEYETTWVCSEQNICISIVLSSKGASASLLPSMSKHTSDSIAYIEIAARDLNEETSYPTTFIPVAQRLQKALDGRYTVVMIDSTDAVAKDVDVLADLLNTRSYNGVDLATVNFIVLARDESLAQRVNNINVLTNHPHPSFKQRVEEQRSGQTMGQQLTPDVKKPL